jgi:FtsH-binding integral membrane protein
MEYENGDFEKNENTSSKSNMPALPTEENTLGVTEFYPDAESSYEKKENVRYDEIFENGKKKTLAFSIVSLVTGILSVLCCCFYWVSLPLGIIAIVFAAISRYKLGYFDGMAIAGLILGIFGTVIGTVVIILSFSPIVHTVISEITKELPNDTDI